MVCVRLMDDSLADDLVGFLRRCECDVEQLSPSLLSVAIRGPDDAESAVRRLRSGGAHRLGAESAPTATEIRDDLDPNGDRGVPQGLAGAPSGRRREARGVAATRPAGGRAGRSDRASPPTAW
jgi:hypothetical protein